MKNRYLEVVEKELMEGVVNLRNLQETLAAFGNDVANVDGMGYSIDLLISSAQDSVDKASTKIRTIMEIIKEELHE